MDYSKLIPFIEERLTKHHELYSGQCKAEYWEENCAYAYNLMTVKNTNYPSIWFTTAAKDIQWKSNIKQKPVPIEQVDTETIHHLDYIQRFYD